MGTIITQSNNIEYEILKKIQMGNKCYDALRNLFKPNIHVWTKRCKNKTFYLNRFIKYTVSSKFESHHT